MATSTAGVYWVHRTSAKGDGTTDDSTAIQDLIDTASGAGGGIVYFQAGKTYACNLTLKSNVMLVGQGTIAKHADVGSKLIAAATGVVIDTPASAISNCGIAGLNVYGLGSDTACKGIRFQQVTRGVIANFTVQQMADEAISIGSSSVACFIADGLIQDSVLDTSRAAKIGALDLSGTDHYLHNLEVTTSQSAITDSNLYLCALAIRGANSMLSNVVGEISDIGFYVTGNPAINRFVNCRADLNWGHGFEVDGQRNMFAACLAWRNSRGTHDTYSGFHVTSNARLNLFAGCFSGGLGSDSALAQKYGFEDLITASSGRSVYVGCRGTNNGTNEHYIDGAGADSDTSTTSWT